MSKIVALEVNLPMRTDEYRVGKPLHFVSEIASSSLPKGVVTEIKDASVELESSLHLMYQIFVDGKLFRQIENTPVTVEFEI